MKKEGENEQEKMCQYEVEKANFVGAVQFPSVSDSGFIGTITTWPLERSLPFPPVGETETKFNYQNIGNFRIKCRGTKIKPIIAKSLTDNKMGLMLTSVAVGAIGGDLFRDPLPKEVVYICVVAMGVNCMLKIMKEVKVGSVPNPTDKVPLPWVPAMLACAPFLPLLGSSLLSVTTKRHLIYVVVASMLGVIFGVMAIEYNADAGATPPPPAADSTATPPPPATDSAAILPPPAADSAAIPPPPDAAATADVSPRRPSFSASEVSLKSAFQLATYAGMFAFHFRKIRMD